MRREVVDLPTGEEAEGCDGTAVLEVVEPPGEDGDTDGVAGGEGEGGGLDGGDGGAGLES